MTGPGTVVVTGAAGGIGRATLALLGERGYRVLAVDLPGSDLDGALHATPGSGHAGLAVDLTEVAGHAEVFRSAAALGEPVVGLIHLAALMLRRRDVDEVTEEDWDLTLDTNLRTVFFLNRAAWHAMRADGGAIVNAVSQGWWTGGFGGSVVYAAAKGGVVSLVRGLARSFAPTGVRVNAIAPGGVDTPMYHRDLDPEVDAAFVAQIPMGRIATPKEIAGPAVFLVSPESGYMTGSVLNVSGGQLLY